MKIFPLLCLLSVSQPALAFESEWHWIRVEPRDNAAPVTWSVEQGIAKNVAITGSKFTADLYPDDILVHPKVGPDIRLSGTVIEGKVIASATYVGTDAGHETYRGDLRVQAPKGSPETDRITLKGDWADSFIGLTRVRSPR